MDTLESYLATVGKYLPKGQEADILGELRDHLLSLIEDREGALGRPLTEAEQEDLLRAYGEPLAVAGGYRADGGCLAFGPQLIGPALFPFYLRVLSINLAVVMAVTSVALAGTLLAGHSAVNALQSLVFTLVLNFAIVTGIFVAVNRRKAPVGWSWAHWKPRPGTGVSWLKSPSGVRFKAGVAFVALGLWMAFWLAFPKLGLVVFLGPGAFVVGPGPGWPYFYYTFLALMVGNWVLAALVFAMPERPLVRNFGQLVMDLAGLILFTWGLTHGAWQLTSGGPMVHGRALSELLNGVIRHGMSYLIPVLALILVAKTWRRFR